MRKAENKSLYDFCLNIRLARNGEGKAKISPERIASLDALGFDWGGAGTAANATRSFEERLEELRQYKIKHGHVDVKVNENKSLYKFRWRMRQARVGKGDRKITPKRIASLDAIGFDWGLYNPFEGRLKELMLWHDMVI